MANEKRLIDANQLWMYAYNEIDRANKRHEGDPEFRKFTENVAELVNALAKDMPTVDAVPVVHGYWIDSHSADHMGRIIEHSIDCSVCDSVFKDDSREVVKYWKKHFKVCPFCGALMDGDGNG